MLPYADDTKTFSPPTWIFLLIMANAVAFVMSYAAGAEHYVQTIFAYGAIPARFFPGGNITSGYAEYLSKYMASANIDPSTWAPPFLTLFTSMFLHGGIFHLIGNMWFLWLFGDNVEDRLGKLIFPIFYIYIGLWLLLQFFGGFVETGSNVAFMAHIGGFICGLSLAVILDKIKLITWCPGDRNYTRPDFVDHPSLELQGTVYRSPLSSGPTYTGDVDSHGVTPFQPANPPSTGQRIKRRYVWKE
ncbi:MAG: rhomboid family intramembrane serine protease [bacterium]|nr:rhomboid family intramembrane serine protease [bacterium]